MTSSVLANRLPLTANRSIDGWRAISVGEFYIYTVPVAAGAMALVDGVKAGGFALSGWVWVFYYGFGCLIVIGRMAFRRPLAVAFPCGLWLCWLCLLGLSLFWCPDIQFRNIQELLQLSMPVLIGVLSSALIRSNSQLRLLLRSFFPCLACLLLSIVCLRVGLLKPAFDQGNRVGALTAALAGVIILAGFPQRKLIPIVGWLGALAFTVVTGSRMATVAMLLVPIFHPLIRQIWIRPVLLGLLLILAVAAFYSPIFQERFFASGSGDLEDLFRGDALDFGRFDAWPLILREAFRRPLIGWGVGSTYDYVPLVWPEMHMVHNDYLRVFFENGLIGLGVLGSATAIQLLSLLSRIRRSEEVIREAFAAAFLGFGALLVTAASDNPLVYNVWFMNPLFAVLGAAYGAARGEWWARSRAAPLEPSNSPLSTLKTAYGRSTRRRQLTIERQDLA